MHSPLALVRDPSADPAASGAAAPRGAEPFDALEHLVGVNLARLRAERQLSLDALARASGVSRAMLAQIESARSVPSIKVLCKVAAALKVSVAAFLRRHATNGFEHLPADRSTRTVSSNGRYSARPLYPEAEPSAAEFHELRIAPLHTEEGTRRAPGTTVNLVVSEGTLEVSVHDQRQLLATGDAIVFDADQPHSLRNPGDTEARAFRVTLKAETPPRWDVPPASHDARQEPARDAGPVSRDARDRTHDDARHEAPDDAPLSSHDDARHGSSDEAAHPTQNEAHRQPHQQPHHETTRTTPQQAARERAPISLGSAAP